MNAEFDHDNPLNHADVYMHTSAEEEAAAGFPGWWISRCIHGVFYIAGDGVPTREQCSVCHEAGSADDFHEILCLIIDEGYGDGMYEREIYWGRWTAGRIFVVLPFGGCRKGRVRRKAKAMAINI